MCFIHIITNIGKNSAIIMQDKILHSLRDCYQLSIKQSKIMTTTRYNTSKRLTNVRVATRHV